MNRQSTKSNNYLFTRFFFPDYSYLPTETGNTFIIVGKYNS